MVSKVIKNTTRGGKHEGTEAIVGSVLWENTGQAQEETNDPQLIFKKPSSPRLQAPH